MTRGRVAAAVVAATVLVGLAPTAQADAAARPRAATDRCVITRTHQIFLGRSPTEAEVTTWSDRLDAGEPAHRLPQELATSDEWLGVVVRGLYQDALDRDPDAAGRAHWVAQLRSGALVNRVASLIYGSDEYRVRTGGTDAGFVADIYRRILHRPPDAAGRAHWEGEVAARGRGRVASLFFASVESRRDRVDALYAQVLGRPADAAGRAHWIDQLATVNDVRLAVLLASSAELHDRGCPDPALDAFVADITARAHRTVLGRPPTPAEERDRVAALRAQPYHQWLVADLMSGAEYRDGLGRLADDAFVSQAYANAGGGGPTEAVRARWVAELASEQRSRLDLLVTLVETVGAPLQTPDAPVPCARFDGGGTVVPVCRAGSAGDTQDSVFVTVPGTVTKVNLAGLPRMWAFLDAARRAGFAVDANGVYGSARTREQQEYLYTHGFPANPPGTSMHEWGLALDVACDGLSWSQSAPDCRQWVVAHAGTHGFSVHATEAWHYSTDGRVTVDKGAGLTLA